MPGCGEHSVGLRYQCKAVTLLVKARCGDVRVKILRIESIRRRLGYGVLYKSDYGDPYKTSLSVSTLAKVWVS